MMTSTLRYVMCLNSNVSLFDDILKSTFRFVRCLKLNVIKLDVILTINLRLVICLNLNVIIFDDKLKNYLEISDVLEFKWIGNVHLLTYVVVHHIDVRLIHSDCLNI
jgi:hypothetical protein